MFRTPSNKPFGEVVIFTFRVPKPHVPNIDREALQYLRSSFATRDTVLADGQCVIDWCYLALIANFDQILLLRASPQTNGGRPRTQTI